MIWTVNHRRPSAPWFRTPLLLWLTQSLRMGCEMKNTTVTHDVYIPVQYDKCLLGSQKINIKQVITQIKMIYENTTIFNLQITNVLCTSRFEALYGLGGDLSCNFTQFLRYKLPLTNALSQRGSLASRANSLFALEHSPSLVLPWSRTQRTRAIFSPHKIFSFKLFC